MGSGLGIRPAHEQKKLNSDNEGDVFVGEYFLQRPVVFDEEEEQYFE